MRHSMLIIEWIDELDNPRDATNIMANALINTESVMGIAAKPVEMSELPDWYADEWHVGERDDHEH